MGEITFKIFGAALISVSLIVILRKQSPDTALTLRLIASAVLALASISAITPIIVYARELAESVGEAEKLIKACEVLLKALGISILTHVTATVCRDSGEGSIAYYVELGGKAEILLLSIPLIREVVDMTVELVGMG